MKKVLMIIGGIFVFMIILAVVILGITALTSKKLVCESENGSITILHNNKTITGYTARNYTYDLDGQKEYAEQIGVEAYIDEFKEWFEENTNGTCK